MEFIGPALILFVILVMPILAITVGALGIIVARQWFSLQHKRLELRRWELEQRLEIQRLAADLPPWVDENDPIELRAWRAALKETWSAGKPRQLYSIETT